MNPQYGIPKLQLWFVGFWRITGVGQHSKRTTFQLFNFRIKPRFFYVVFCFPFVDADSWMQQLRFSCSVIIIPPTVSQETAREPHSAAAFGRCHVATGRPIANAQGARSRWGKRSSWWWSLDCGTDHQLFGCLFVVIFVNVKQLGIFWDSFMVKITNHMWTISWHWDKKLVWQYYYSECDNGDTWRCLTKIICWHS